MSTDAPVRSAEDVLLEYLRERDVPCPRCGYNLRNVTGAACPECGDAITLRIAAKEPWIGWFILTLFPMCGIVWVGMWLIVVDVVFGGIGTFGNLLFPGAIDLPLLLVLTTHSQRFIRLKDRWQIIWAVISWILHVVTYAIILFYL